MKKKVLPLLAAVKEVVPAVHAAPAPISASDAPPEALGPAAVHAFPEGHRHGTGGSAQVLALRVL